jgi:hypothetical protein
MVLPSLKSGDAKIANGECPTIGKRKQARGAWPGVVHPI